ncbi:MAG: OmpA family protein [Silicimonas sp.]|nr:OmpA family protein [Silicimonas sp.]
MFRVLPILAFAASPAFACPQYDTVVAAVQADDQSGAEVLYEEIVFSAACDDAIREWVADYLARENFLAALDSDKADEKRRLLTRALGFEKHWRSYAELGRLDWAEGQYSKAAQNLQLALNELAEGDQSHKADTDEIGEVYELATAALALADEPVDMPRTRSGTTGGIFTTSIRGFEVEEVSLPITFEYNSTEFDQIGTDFADALVEHVALTSPNLVVLAGHTDPTGSDAYNLTLSEARADAVRELLVANGYNGEVEVEGFGETRLPPAPPGIEPNSEEHYRLARRVAFSLK